MGKFNISSGPTGPAVPPVNVLEASQAVPNLLTPVQQLAEALNIPPQQAAPADLSAITPLPPEAELPQNFGGDPNLVSPQQRVGALQYDADQQQLRALEEAELQQRESLSLGERLGAVESEANRKISTADKVDPIENILDFSERWRQGTDIESPIVGATFSVDKGPVDNTLAGTLGKFNAVEEYQTAHGNTRAKPTQADTAIASIAFLAALDDAQTVAKEETKAVNQDLAKRGIEDTQPTAVKKLAIGDGFVKNYLKLKEAESIDTGRGLPQATAEDRALLQEYGSGVGLRLLGDGIEIQTDPTTGIQSVILDDKTEEMVRAAAKETKPLLQRDLKPLRYVTETYDSSRRTKPAQGIDKTNDPVELAMRTQQIMPFRVYETPANLYSALLGHVSAQAQIGPQGNLTAPISVPGADIFKSGPQYASKKDLAKATAGLRAAQATSQGLRDAQRKIFTYGTFASGRQNRISLDTEQVYDFQKNPDIRMIIGDPAPQHLNAKRRNEGTMGFEAAVARTMHTSRDPAGNKLKEGDWTPHELVKIFNSPAGIDKYRTIIGNPQLAVSQIHEMNRVSAEIAAGNLPAETLVPVPDFITNNPEIFLSEDIEGFNKAVAMIETAKYLSALDGNTDGSFVTTLNVELDGNNSGPAIQAYYTGQAELAAATGMMNASEELTYGGSAKLRAILGEHLQENLKNTPMHAGISDEVAPQLRQLMEGVLDKDKFRKSLVQSVGYGQDPDHLGNVVEKFLNDNRDIQESIQRVVEGTNMAMADVIESLSVVAGIGMKNTLGKDTFNFYLRPLNTFTLFSKLMSTLPVLMFADGTLANAADSRLTKGEEVGKVQFYTDLQGQEKRTQSSAYAREYVEDPSAPGKVSKNPSQRPGHTALKRTTPIATHNVDAAVERKMYEEYRNGNLGYSYQQIYDANVIPASKYFSHYKLKNSHISPVLEKMDPVQAAVNSFDAILLPGFKKWLDQQPDFIEYETSPAGYFIEEDMFYYLKKLRAPLDLSADQKNAWAKAEVARIKKALKPVISKKRGENIHKSDYFNLVGQLVNQLGGRASIADAADMNKKNRQRKGIVDAKKTHYS